jgi:SAM-dependent methyltransferase
MAGGRVIGAGSNLHGVHDNMRREDRPMPSLDTSFTDDVEPAPPPEAHDILKMPQPPTKHVAEPISADDPVVRYFNELDAAAYADHYAQPEPESSPSTYFFQRRRALVMRHLETMKGGAILDIGCGPGVFANLCVERGFRYHGFDISERMIGEARRRFGNREGIEFTVGDARRLPLPSNSVDGVLCLGMLEYVSREDEAIYLQEMARVVKPGGVLIFSFLNARSPHWLVGDYVFPAFRLCLWHIKEVLKKLKLAPVRDFSPRAFRTRKFKLGERVALLRDMGLSLAGKFYFSPNILPPHVDSVFARQSAWMTAALEPLMVNPVFSWVGQAFIVIVQK